MEEVKPIYTSRIIKASVLIADTKVLLSEWDPDQSLAENMDRVGRANTLGKASRSRVKDLRIIFRQRYFDDPDVGRALVALVQGGAPAAWVDPLLYFFSAQNDRTMRDMVLEVLYPRWSANLVDLPVEVVARALRGWVSERKMTRPWGEETQGRVAQGLMATLRDFGILGGQANKRLAPVYLATPPFVMIGLWLLRQLDSGNLVLTSDEWRLFFLSVEGVERQFIEAHQEHLLSYDAAGSIVRIEYPAANLTEYAHALLERAHRNAGG